MKVAQINAQSITRSPAHERPLSHPNAFAELLQMHFIPHMTKFLILMSKIENSQMHIKN